VFAVVGRVVEQQVIDGICIAAQDDPGEDVGEISLGIDAAQFSIPSWRSSTVSMAKQFSTVGT